MKRSFFVFLFFSLLLNFSFGQDKAYVIYNSKGKKVKYKKLLEMAGDKDYVLFGEYHDNPISHWLQLELTQDLYSEYSTKLKLSFEQIEQDQQLLLNDFMIGKFDYKTFKDTMRLWPNHKTDYQPLIDFAKENNLFCLAANIPRKYASLLYKKGRGALDSLTDLEKSYIAPLDFKVDTTLSQYQVFLTGDMHSGGMNMLLAQAIKDATMAHFMMLNRKKDEVMIHFVGAFHSDFYQGIMWYLQQQEPASEIMTITTVSQADINKLDEENKGRADFIICVAENMTSTH
jgi:uncharacterized iron-regulated protein